VGERAPKENTSRNTFHGLELSGRKHGGTGRCKPGHGFKNGGNRMRDHAGKNVGQRPEKGGKEPAEGHHGKPVTTRKINVAARHQHQNQCEQGRDNRGLQEAVLHPCRISPVTRQCGTEPHGNADHQRNHCNQMENGTFVHLRNTDWIFLTAS